MNIFISYRRDDTGYIASMLAEKLEQEIGNSAVFLDVDSIPLGSDFRTHIDSAVAKCDVLLALIGDDWLQTDSQGKRRIDSPVDYVRIELESALRRDIPVIPVLTGNSTIPLEVEIPQSLSTLVYRNAAELRPGPTLRNQFAYLVQQIKRFKTKLEHSEERASADQVPPILVGFGAREEVKTPQISTPHTSTPPQIVSSIEAPKGLARFFVTIVRLFLAILLLAIGAAWAGFVVGVAILASLWFWDLFNTAFVTGQDVNACLYFAAGACAVMVVTVPGLVPTVFAAISATIELLEFLEGITTWSRLSRTATSLKAIRRNIWRLLIRR